MDPAAALKAFAAVFPAELPDKTMVATIVLVTRYHRPLAVWCGAALAFALHVTIAVTAGSLLTLLPEAVVTVATAGLFATGAVLLWRSAGAATREATADLDAAGDTGAGAGAGGVRQAVLGSFAVVGLAEWGDLTQLATAGIAGSTGSPVAVGVGALLALWAVCGLAATAGRGLVKVLPLDRLQRAAAGVFLTLALITLWGLR